MPAIVTVCKSKLICMKYTGVIGVIDVTGVIGVADVIGVIGVTDVIDVIDGIDVTGVTGVIGVMGAQPRNKRVERIKDSIGIYKQIFRSHPKASQWGGKRGSARRLIPGVRRS